MLHVVGPSHTFVIMPSYIFYDDMESQQQSWLGPSLEEVGMSVIFP